MGVSGVNAVGSVSGVQSVSGRQADSASKGIQDEIANVQRQKQELSSRKDMSVEEKAKKRQELQKEISSLNTKLRQQQAVARKEQQKETVKEELKALRGDEKRPGDKEAEEKASAIKDAKPNEAGAGSIGAKGARPDETGERGAGTKAARPDRAGTSGIGAKDAGTNGVKTKDVRNEDSRVKESRAKALSDKDAEKKAAEIKDADGKDKEAGLSPAQVRGIAEADSKAEQSKVQESIIARIEGGIAILKGELEQDEMQGADAAPKRQELAKQEQRAQWASEAPFSDLGTAQKTEKEKPQDKNAALENGFSGVMGDNSGKIIFRDTDYFS